LELEDVFRAHQRAVFAYFLRVVGTRQDAEELTQETFVRACSAAIRFRGDSNVRTWLFGIARRVLLEASRAGLFERRPPLDEARAAAADDDPDTRIDLERALSSLGVGDREALVMVDVLGFEPHDAAPILGLSADTFRVRLHRARRRFREVYGDV
jgi:RNA polymerase sigma-70 factor (ECF subfamily)